jgi:mono/diheme cytochrome c family protein
VRTHRPGGRLVRRWVSFALLVAVPGENAPAADLPRSDQPAVDRAILNGYRRHNASCSHCHGPDGVGSTFAPSLIERPLPLTSFQEIVRDGQASGASAMRGFADDPNLVPHIGDIHAYLQARRGVRRPRQAHGSAVRGGPVRRQYLPAGELLRRRLDHEHLAGVRQLELLGRGGRAVRPDRDHLFLAGHQEPDQTDRCT